MITKEKLADGYALNVRLIKLQTEGLSHEDSLAQTGYNINCLNWVLGHILVARDRALRLLDQEPLLMEAETRRYETGSEPITEESQDAIPLERMVELLERGQERISAGLAEATTEELEREIQVGESTTTVGGRLFGLYFHDTYHTGQTDLLRQVAGKNDKII